MKRVLMIAYFFPPLGGGGCQRTLKLARYLEPNGWASTVVTAKDPDYWILDPTLSEEIPASCEVLRASGLTSQRLLRLLGGAGVPIETKQGTRKAGAFRALRRLQHLVAIPDGYRAWARAAERVAAARIERGGIDALWTTSSPESAHLAGLALKRRHGLQWVADFRDPWVGRATYAPPTSWHDRRHRGLEGSVVESADRITVVSEAMAATFRERYPSIAPERFVVLPNGYDPDDWARAARLTAGAAPDERARRFVVLHAGQLAHRPTVATLLEAARRLVEASPARRDTLRLRFMGGNEDLDEDVLARAGLAAMPEIVEVVPSRPHVEALAAMKRADLLVLLGHGGAGDAQIYTGKIYEYLTSGRPVLGILDEGPAADLLRAAGNAYVCHPGDFNAAREAIESPLKAWESGKPALDAPLPAMASTWTRQVIAREASGLLDSLETIR